MTWERGDTSTLSGALTTQFPSSTFNTNSGTSTSTTGPSSGGRSDQFSQTAVTSPSSSQTTTTQNQQAVRGPSTSVTTDNKVRTGRTTTTDTQTVDSVIESMPAQELAQLRGLVQVLLQGGTGEQQKQMGQKTQAIEFIRSLFEQYTPRMADMHAREAMAYNLQSALEENMPAIQRAIEGAGTSANSMQALLSQKLSTDASLAAGALSAEQQRAYANTIASLAGSFAEISKPDDFLMQDLLKAFDILKGARVKENKTVTNESIQDAFEQIFGLSTTADSGFTTTTTGTTVADTQHSGGSTTTSGTSSGSNWNSGGTTTTRNSSSGTQQNSGGGSSQQPTNSFNSFLPDISSLMGSGGSSSSSGSSSVPSGWWDQDAYIKQYGGNTNLGTITGSNAGDVLSLLSTYG